MHKIMHDIQIYFLRLHIPANFLLIQVDKDSSPEQGNLCFLKFCTGEGK